MSNDKKIRQRYAQSDRLVSPKHNTPSEPEEAKQMPKDTYRKARGSKEKLEQRMSVLLLGCASLLGQAALPVYGEGIRFFDTLANKLIEPCVAYSGGHYAAAFNLQIMDSEYTLSLDTARLLSSTKDVYPLSRYSEIKDCSSIIIDWWGKARYTIPNLPLLQQQVDLQDPYSIRATIDLNNIEEGFNIVDACPRNASDAVFLDCIGQNTPKLDPEHHILVGSSNEIDPFYEEDYRQIMSWLIEMGLGFDRFVHIVYEQEDNNDPALTTLRKLGLSYGGKLVSSIEQIDNRKSCLGGFWSVFEDFRRGLYSFCVQPNPYTDPVWEYDRSVSGLAFNYGVFHGLIHEYFHHTQRAHTLDRSLGTTTDCCGLFNPVEAPPFWIEGAAIVFPDVFLWEKFEELNHTTRNGLRRGNGNYHQSDSPLICQGFDTYLCDRGTRHFRYAKEAVQNNGGRCYLGARDGTDLFDGVIRQPQCDWGMTAYYLAFVTSFQVMWVDIARDMWSLGFPASFEKHVGMTINEFAESYSEFMNSGSPEDPPPEGFFPKKPLSELVDFWELKARPSGQVLPP